MVRHLRKQTHLDGNQSPSKIIASTLAHPSQARGRAVRSRKKVHKNRRGVLTNHTVACIRPCKWNHHTTQLKSSNTQNAAMRKTGEMVSECLIAPND